MRNEFQMNPVFLHSTSVNPFGGSSTTIAQPIREITTVELFEQAVLEGNLCVAKWIHQQLRKKLEDFRINYIFYQLCEFGYLQTIRWLYTEYPSVDIENCFEAACAYGHLELCQWLYKIRPDIDITDALFMVCHGDENLSVLEWLYQTRPEISLKFKDLFDYVCRRGAVRLARWFYQQEPSVLDDETFINACEHRHIDVVEWIHSVQPKKYQYTIWEDGSIHPRLMAVMDKLDMDLLPEKSVSEKSGCIICYEEHSDLITSCEHTYCTSCIQEWISRQQCCAYCRKELSIHTDLFKIKLE